MNDGRTPWIVQKWKVVFINDRFKIVQMILIVHERFPNRSFKRPIGNLVMEL